MSNQQRAFIDSTLGRLATATAIATVLFAGIAFLYGIKQTADEAKTIAQEAKDKGNTLEKEKADKTELEIIRNDIKDFRTVWEKSLIAPNTTKHYKQDSKLKNKPLVDAIVKAN